MFIVTQSNFAHTVETLAGLRGSKAFDTEATGLLPYKGDRLFSVIISTEDQDYYFNFNPYARLDRDLVLPRDWIWRMSPIFAHESDIWAAHNAKFDMHMLAQEGVFIKGIVHCTRSGARIEYNAHMSYKLEHCLPRIGLKKDDSVETYIKKNKLYEKRSLPGRVTQKTFKFFHWVPYDIITPYGCDDGRGALALLKHQEKRVAEDCAGTPAGVPSPRAILDNERSTTKTLFEMERVGLQLDLGYCRRALAHETERLHAAGSRFETLTGRGFQDSEKLLAEVFSGKPLHYTEKGELSFNARVLKSYQDEAANAILDWRDAKSKSDFYTNFLYYADSDGVVHPNFNQDGAGTGRLSSSEPNFHNLTSEDVQKCLRCGAGFEDVKRTCTKCGSTDLMVEEFLVRKAVIARPGFFLWDPDFDQMEFKMMLDYAGAQSLIREVLSGKDVHQATADAVTASGFPCTRGKAKNGNFALIYGSGDKKLAATLGCSVAEAARLRRAIFDAAPEMEVFLRKVMRVAQVRGHIHNWMGRRYYFPDSRFSYKAPNYLIQGGCADLVKVAMNRIADRLRGCKSRMILQVHDELLFEIHETEAHLITELTRIMEAVYPHKHLPLTVSHSHSMSSWAELRAGNPLELAA